MRVATTAPGPIIVIPARTGFGGYRLHDLSGPPHPTGWYRDRMTASQRAADLNVERRAERESSGAHPPE
jgi:hypothetical protein